MTHYLQVQQVLSSRDVCLTAAGAAALAKYDISRSRSQSRSRQVVMMMMRSASLFTNTVRGPVPWMHVHHA